MTERGFLCRYNQLVETDRFLLFHDGRLLVDNGNLYWSGTAIAALDIQAASFYYIDQMNGSSVFALRLKLDCYSQLKAEARSLRSLLLEFEKHDFTLAGKANQILDWHQSHRHCGACGEPTRFLESQRAVACVSCKRQYFPRINPCVIMLINRGEEILLARSARFRTGFYSCLAGFIEVGETPEDTVSREVMEEVGIEVDNIRYIKSQSWPFPSQLMLGYFADYKSGELVLEEEEIEEADWFSYDNLPSIPPANISVAGELIQLYGEWLRSGSRG